MEKTNRLFSVQGLILAKSSAVKEAQLSFFYFVCKDVLLLTECSFKWLLPCKHLSYKDPLSNYHLCFSVRSSTLTQLSLSL